MLKYLFLLAMMLNIALASSPSVAQSDDNMLLFHIPALIAGFQCDEGQFQDCVTPGACRKIKGIWEDRVCTQKPENQLATEILAGKWNVTTSFSNGDFYNYLQFDKLKVSPIPRSADYFIEGESHSTDAYSDTDPNDAVGSYDSTNDDWFILDYWGLDVGTISSIEINKNSNNSFTGCEFMLNYPDLTYQDGVCNPVRLSRTALAKAKVSQANRISVRPHARSKLSGSVRAARTPGTKYRNSATRINSLRAVTGVENDQ
jgi:hypothetical protein